MAVIRQLQPNRQPPAPQQGRDDAKVVRGPAGLSDTSPPGARRLVAVMHADVAGYSRLITMDDAGTVRRLRLLRRALIGPALRQHSGQIVQTGGDSVLIVFDSIEGAVDCAVQVQHQLPLYDGDQPSERRIRFRIGIDVGDAIPQAGDLHGEAVNIAARLQAACPPGGVCISRAVREHIQDRLGGGFVPMGALALKNIERPVEAFVLRLDAVSVAVQPPWSAARLRLAVLAGVAVAIVALAGGATWWLRERTPASPAVATPSPATVPALAAPRLVAYSPQDRRQSIIVLPFENGSGDPAKDSVADGITRDVRTLIARSSGGAMVPAAIAAAYRGKTLDLRAIGREYNVHFALMGDVRRQDGRLAGSATLYDTENVRRVWSAPFDLPDSPDGWRSIVQRINYNAWQGMVDAEASRAMREHPDNLDKRDLMLAVLSTAPPANETKEGDLARIALIERALALDPDYLWALEYEARYRADLVLHGFSSDPDADLAIAAKAVDHMFKLSPDSRFTLTTRAIVLYAQGKLDEAAALQRRVIELEPLESNRYLLFGFILLDQGHSKEALDEFMTAKRLAAETNPVYASDEGIALALAASERWSEAIAQARLAIAEAPPASGWVAEMSRLALIAAESASGQDAAARAELQEFLATPRRVRSMSEIPKSSPLVANAKLAEALRRAGMPEQ
jgi:class 3 adenylate cyclase/TolB-like protein/tetratricopeptide (TPR) repeat protein